MTNSHTDSKVLTFPSQLPKIQIVTLDNYYACIEDSFARKLFSGLTLLRSRGYGPDYPKHFLPFDMSDLIAEHHLFCVVDAQGELTPIGAIRQVTVQRCDAYAMELPIYKLLKEENSHPNAEILEAMINDYRTSGRKLSYSSGLNIQKKWRENKPLSRLMLDLAAVLTHVDMVEQNIETTICACAPRFKTNELFEKWGYVMMKDGGKQLPPIERKSINDVALLMEWKTTSSYTLERYEQYRDLIESRIIISPERLQERKISGAA